MSTVARTRRPARATPARQAAARRRIVLFLAAVAVIVGGAAVLLPTVDDAVQEVTLPLRHDDIIRQQARDKQLDASLIAAVIYAESRFTDATSHAGARGLMQITPQTADEIARRSGGTQFRQDDLAEPQINISYGSWYLRWLMKRYGENEMLAVAAYNAGTGNVDRWIAADPGMNADEIPFPETKAYVSKVLTARRDYERVYPRELGI
jgi:soluble lytic murein transglycosylase